MADIFERLEKVIRAELNQALDKLTAERVVTKTVNEESEADQRGHKEHARLSETELKLSEALEMLEYTSIESLPKDLAEFDQLYWKTVQQDYLRSYTGTMGDMLSTEARISQFRQAYYLLEQVILSLE